MAVAHRQSHPVQPGGQVGIEFIQQGGGADPATEDPAENERNKHGDERGKQKWRINLQAGGDLADHGQRVADFQTKNGCRPGRAFDRVKIVFRIADKRVGQRLHDVIELLLRRR